jgi:hypothetical protein
MFTSAIRGRLMCIDALHGREKNFEVVDVVIEIVVRMNKSRMLASIILQCRYHYLSMFLIIFQPPDFTAQPATWILTIVSKFSNGQLFKA